MSAFRTYAHDSEDLQRPFEASVIVTTILRPKLADALRSVFSQDLDGRIQVLIGVDYPEGSLEIVDEACEDRPSNCAVQVFYPGYSTSARHGGVHPAYDGGATRSILTYLANSRRVTYLDDDNWYAPNHLSSLLEAIGDRDWAYSYRWFVHPESRVPVCIDQWESVGPDKGFQAQDFGGFSDTNTLMIDKLRCEPIIRLWSLPLDGDREGMSADRNVFKTLRDRYRHVASEKATVFYEVDPNNSIHRFREQWMGAAYAEAGKGTRPAQRRRTFRDSVFKQGPYQGLSAKGLRASLEDARPINPILQYAIPKNRPKVIVEVGVGAGTSSVLTAKLLKAHGLTSAEVICVDTWLGSAEQWLNPDETTDLSPFERKHGYPALYRRFLKNVVASGVAEIVTPLPLPSRDALTVLRHHKVKADMVVLHASRDYRAFMEDLTLYWELLRYNGVIMGEDFSPNWTGVVRAVSEFAEQVGAQIVRTKDGQSWALPR